MKNTSKKGSFFMMVCALLCAFSIGAASCGENGNNSSTSNSESESSVSASESSESESSSGNESNSESSENSESTSDSETSELPEETDNYEAGSLSILAPAGEIYSYVDAAKNFLAAGEGADIANYYVKGMKNPQIAVPLKWKYDDEGAKKFVVEYATNADYSDAITVELGAAKRSYDLYNLYKGANYHLRITVVDEDGRVLNQTETEFQTTDLGPRVMNVEGAYNVRDLGGFETSFGKALVQGIAYRGGMLHYNATGNNGDLTEKGKKTLSEELGITSELDFRSENEAWVTMEDGSSIPGAKLTYITAGGYDDIFKGEVGKGQKEVYREIFSYLADETNYPLYYHCTAGADRTGTVSYILHAFLGVSELECHQDFAFTSFSVYGMRASQSGAGDNSDRYMMMVNALKAYPGATLQEKAQNYLLEIGVTEAELENLKGIFFGEVEIPGAKVYNPNVATATARTAEKQKMVEADDGYSVYTITKVGVQMANSTSSVLYLYSSDGDAFPKDKIRGDWSSVYTLEAGSGKGLTMNGTVVTSGKIKLPSDLYLPLDTPAQVGDILVINGTYSSADTKIRLVFENCAIQWDGTNWNPISVKDTSDYTIHNLGQLAVHKHSDGSTTNVPKATQLYMKIASGMAIPYPDANWDTEFALESGAGWKINGVSIKLPDIESSNSGLYVNTTAANVKVGDVLSVEGTFTCDREKAKYVIAESKFTWNGTAWEDYVGETPGTNPGGGTDTDDYIVHNLGKLAVHGNSSGATSNAPRATQLYMKIASGMAIPYPDSEWDTEFALESGAGWKVNGVSVSLPEMESSNSGLFINLTAANIKVGDILSVEGTFASEDVHAKYVITESCFIWNGTAWENYIEYITYEVGALAFSKATPSNDQTPIPNAYTYFARADGQKMPIYSTENNLHWDTKFSWKDGVGITINDVEVKATVKFPSEMFVAFKTAPQIGDVLKIGGIFYSEAITVQYIIEESVFEWSGDAWLPRKDYVVYEVGALTVANGQTSASSLTLNRGDGGSFENDNLSYTFSFYQGSGVGILLNGEALTATTMKTSAQQMVLNLGASVKDGDVLRVGGTFYSVNLSIKYVVTESAFIYENGAWNVYSSAYNEIGVGKVSIHHDASSAKFIYFLSVYTDLVFPVDTWKSAVVCVYGMGVQLNGMPLENAKIRSIDSTIYLSLREEDVQKGDVITIGGKFVCEAEGVLYYVTQSTFVWNGTIWEAEENASLSEWKAYVKTALDSYKDVTEFEESVQTAIQAIVANAKTEVDASKTFLEMGKAVASAKLAINALTVEEEPEIPVEPEEPDNSETSEQPSDSNSEMPEQSDSSDTSVDSKEEASNGCGSVIGLTAGATVLAAAAFVTIRKKREE